jgi:hypothetical protein
MICYCTLKLSEAGSQLTSNWHRNPLRTLSARRWVWDLVENHTSLLWNDSLGQNATPFNMPQDSPHTPPVYLSSHLSPACRFQSAIFTAEEKHEHALATVGCLTSSSVLQSRLTSGPLSWLSGLHQAGSDHHTWPAYGPLIPDSLPLDQTMVAMSPDSGRQSSERTNFVICNHPLMSGAILPLQGNK